jgi:hypothetical protein
MSRTRFLLSGRVWEHVPTPEPMSSSVFFIYKTNNCARESARSTHLRNRVPCSNLAGLNIIPSFLGVITRRERSCKKSRLRLSTTLLPHGWWRSRRDLICTDLCGADMREGNTWAWHCICVSLSGLILLFCPHGYVRHFRLELVTRFYI